MQLSELPKGSRALVSKLNFEVEHSTLERRLLLMGLRPGATVEMAGKSPFGDPYVVRLRHQSFGLRREVLRQIEVTLLD
jgi:Fe2+ transport system protein FeoA